MGGHGSLKHIGSEGWSVLSQSNCAAVGHAGQSSPITGGPAPQLIRSGYLGATAQLHGVLWRDVDGFNGSGLVWHRTKPN